MNSHPNHLKVKLPRKILLPDSNGPKEIQFEAKRQSQKIDLMKWFSLPAANQDAKLMLQAEVATLKSEHLDLDDLDNDLFL